MSTTRVERIIKKTSQALWGVMLEEGYLKIPQNSSDWKKIAKDFERKRNFPNCVGVMDGKHVVMQAPVRSG